MAQMHEVELEIDNGTGEITFVVNGIKGRDCHNIAEIFNKALGFVQEVRLKEEYFEQLQVKTKIQLKRNTG